MLKHEMNLSTIIVTMVFDSWSGIAYASVHFVKQSQRTSIYLAPFFVRGNDPKTPIATRSIASPTRNIPSGALLVRHEGFREAHV